MRLLVRSNAHRQLAGGGAELASSPDTMGREQWRWDLRLEGVPEARTEMARQRAVPRQGRPDAAPLVLTFDPTQVSVHLDVLDVAAGTRLDRLVGELLVIVADAGNLLVEKRHRLQELDVMVLEGDDPLFVAITPDDGTTAHAAIARISSVDGTRIAWVP